MSSSSAGEDSERVPSPSREIRWMTSDELLAAGVTTGCKKIMADVKKALADADASVGAGAGASAGKKGAIKSTKSAISNTIIKEEEKDATGSSSRNSKKVTAGTVTVTKTSKRIKAEMDDEDDNDNNDDDDFVDVPFGKQTKTARKRQK
jgi:hypothetical protein